MKTMVATVAILGLTLAAGVATADMERGRAGGPGMMPPGPPPFLRQVFPPKMVMEHQRELELRPEQIAAIKQAMNETQTQLNDLQWQLDAESETLNRMLEPARVELAAVLAQLDRVTGLEQQLKRANFGLLVRIKNELDAEQQAKLRQLPPPFGFRGPHGKAAE